MIRIETTIRQAIEKLNRIPRKMERAVYPALSEAADLIVRIMRRPGLEVRYPIQWDSIKQKIFVIAKLRAEGNLPYERTGETPGAWQKQALSNGYSVSNIGHKAVFLYGTPSGTLPGAVHVLPTGQSHIHQGRWRLIKPVTESVLSRLPKSLLERFGIESNA